MQISHLAKSLLMILLLSLLSCGKSKDEEVSSAISEAQYFLNSKDCSSALDVLDDVGQQKDNAEYVASYASALACQAGYSDLNILENLTSIDTTDPQGSGFIKSFASFQTSIETGADEVSYSKLFEAIEYLLEASGGTQPSTADRVSTYGQKKANDLAMQALLMTTTAFGKYFALYGNSDDSGTKGAGSIGINSCLYSYTLSDVIDYIGDAPGNVGGCTATGSEGSAFLSAPVTDDLIKERLCEGVFLFNNMFEILGNISLSENDSLGDLSDIQTVINTILLAAELIESAGGTDGYNDAPAYSDSISVVKQITGMSSCEALPVERLEKWYGILIETIF